MTRENTAFKSWQSFSYFEQKVRKNNRSFFDEESMSFLDVLLKTTKIGHIDIGKKFWRSQLGSGIRSEVCGDKDAGTMDFPCPYPPERMTPRQDVAYEGRANHKGIPYLYLATDKETAISEARPWIGADISVAEFEIIKDLKIVDCSSSSMKTPLFFDIDKGIYEPDDENKKEAVWTHVQRAFSKPVTRRDDVADYAVTQIISEYFKKNQFDGILYKSMLGTGKNLVLFDISSATIQSCQLYEITNVNFQFDTISDPYYIEK